jgi:hypothetical protein
MHASYIEYKAMSQSVNFLDRLRQQNEGFGGKRRVPEDGI